jgi:hypothetical protein
MDSETTWAISGVESHYILSTLFSNHNALYIWNLTSLEDEAAQYFLDSHSTPLPMHNIMLATIIWLIVTTHLDPGYPCRNSTAACVHHGAISIVSSRWSHPQWVQPSWWHCLCRCCHLQRWKYWSWTPGIHQSHPEVPTTNPSGLSI